MKFAPARALLFLAVLFVAPGSAETVAEEAPLGAGIYFMADPVEPGGLATLQIVAVNRGEADLAEIAFEVELDAVLPGLRHLGPSDEEPCGEGSRVAGEGTLRIRGGRLASGGECNFTLLLAVPPDAPWPRAFRIATGELRGRAASGEVRGPGAEDDLDVGPPAAVPDCFRFFRGPCLVLPERR